MAQHACSLHASASFRPPTRAHLTESKGDKRRAQHDVPHMARRFTDLMLRTTCIAHARPAPTWKGRIFCFSASQPTASPSNTHEVVPGASRPGRRARMSGYLLVMFSEFLCAASDRGGHMCDHHIWQRGGIVASGREG